MPTFTIETNTPFTRSSKRRANVEQSKPDGTPPPGWNVGLEPIADHVLYRPSNYYPPALLISIRRRANVEQSSSKHRADAEQLARVF